MTTISGNNHITTTLYAYASISTSTIYITAKLDLMLLETYTRDSYTSEFMAARNHYVEHTYLINIFRYYTVITTFKEERADTDYGSHIILLRFVHLQYLLTSYLHTSYLLRYSAMMIVLSTPSCTT